MYTDAIHIRVYICVIFNICFQVIICTDGQANIGLGQLDQVSSHWPAPSPYFYNQLAHYAAEKGWATAKHESLSEYYVSFSQCWVWCITK